MRCARRTHLIRERPVLPQPQAPRAARTTTSIGIASTLGCTTHAVARKQTATTLKPISVASSRVDPSQAAANADTVSTGSPMAVTPLMTARSERKVVARLTMSTHRSGHHVDGQGASSLPPGVASETESARKTVLLTS